MEDELLWTELILGRLEPGGKRLIGFSPTVLVTSAMQLAVRFVAFSNGRVCVKLRRLTGLRIVR